MRRSTLVVFLLLAACTQPNPNYSPGLTDGPRPADRTIRHDGDVVRDSRHVDVVVDDLTSRDGPPSTPNGVDVLLVIDNSPGMGTAQQILAQDISSLTTGLEALPGGANFRVGIVTTDLGVGLYANTNCTATGDGGKLQLSSSCAQPSGGVRYVQRIGTASNVSGGAANAISCIVQQQTEYGCGFERPLESMRQAVSVNPGFLRADAALAIVILTNEDDCSAATDELYNPSASLGPYASYRCFQYGVLCNGQPPPQEKTIVQGCKPGGTYLHDVKTRYLDPLLALKPAGWVSVLVLAAQPKTITEIDEVTTGSKISWLLKPACSSNGIQADPAFRLTQFVDGMGTQGLFSSICTNSYASALKGLVLRIQSAF
jgi:hypothetical protein